MADIHDRRETLIAEFTENYMEKIFYFCLKKTGNAHEAEDLTQDIAVNVIAALQNTAPANFSAWVWQIARNRYSAWADRKNKRAENVADFDLTNCDVADEKTDVLEDLIHSEELSLLRRELAFIGNDYRNIVVAYYVKDESVHNIARSLSLSENAVKQRLHRARKILKEGIDMAREFGKLSYAPENIAFINNGIQGSNGEPWNYLTRALCKNIMLAAYRTPSTAEELSIEVGVALPYMQEELESLVQATLMKKNGNKYETNFFIVSAEAQEKILAHLKDITPELTKAAIEAVEFKVKWNNENSPKWHEGYQEYEDMKWVLLLQEADIIFRHTVAPFSQNAEDVTHIGRWGFTRRPNNGEWDIMGMESKNDIDPFFIGLSGCVSSPTEKDLPYIDFMQYRFEYKNCNTRSIPVITYTDGQALVDVAKGNAEKINEAVLKRLEEYGYITKTDGGYRPTFLVSFKENKGKMPKEIREELKKLTNTEKDIATRHYLFCRDQIHEEIPDFLKDDKYQIGHACANIFTLREAIFKEAIRIGYIKYREDKSYKGIGACLTV